MASDTTRAPALGWTGAAVTLAGGIALTAGVIGGVSNSDAPPDQQSGWPGPVGVTGGVLMISGLALLTTSFFMNPPWERPRVRIIGRQR